MAKDVYEISVWEDYLVAASETVPAHFEERKLAIIGSNTNTSACRAFEPKLVENINGSNTLTFKMYYIVNEDGESRQNPFLNLMVNERKVKAFWKDKWYDLVVKNCQEDSSGKSITYTCTDLYINELSKTGLDLEFDAELDNNQGNITTLAAAVLEGSDWQLDTANTDIIQQTLQDPLYEVVTLNQFLAVNDSKSSEAQYQQCNSSSVYSSIRPYYTTDGVKFTRAYPTEEQFNLAKSYYYINTGEEIIPASKTILVFYSSVNKRNLYCQFLYNQDGTYPRDTNSQLVIDTDCYSVTLAGWQEVTSETGATLLQGYVLVDGVSVPLFEFVEKGGVSSEYKGSRLVRSQVCELDSITGKYCYEFVATSSASVGGQSMDIGDKIYCYHATEYRDPTVVNNLIVNPNHFTSVEGWVGDDLVYSLYPEYSSDIKLSTYEAKSYLQMTGAKYYPVYNTGARESSSYIPDGFQRGEEYIFRIKSNDHSQRMDYTQCSAASVYDEDETYYILVGVSYQRSYPTEAEFNADKTHYYTGSIRYINMSTHATPQICKYTEANGRKIPVANTNYFSIETAKTTYTEGWTEWTLLCDRSITRSQIYTDKLGIFINFDTAYYWIEDVQFFPLVYGQSTDSEGELITVRINPGEMETQSIAVDYYRYFNYTKAKEKGITSSEDLEFLYVGTTEWNYNGIEAVYNDNFEKIRSITAKNSNRFNLLQTLAETFECWCRFTIQHNEATGQIVYVNGIPQKFVSFVEEVGEETGVGFIYGIDLKTISRTIKSDQIVTKTVVSANSNEYGTNGFCTIARSEENYPRDTFILNFDYYISQNLLDSEELNKDLYLSTDTSGIAYYYWLNKYNTEYDTITQLLIDKKTELVRQNAYVTTYESYLTSLEQQKGDLASEIMRLAGVSTMDEAQSYVLKCATDMEVISRMSSWQNIDRDIESYSSILTGLTSSVAALEEAIEAKESRQQELLDLAKAKHLQFYKKYSRFIQEGSWMDEEYVDDTLYYLDAQSVAYTSARPQISYNISVLRISSIEGFENKIFHLGDISYIQDTEFFGYTYVNQVKTPYKEKVLVSEITSNFDAPDQDTFKIQNYKTQFEDLFQRITSTTQSLQYASGEYARAASIVETNGTIKVETLQNSIALNSELVYSAQNESVIQDSTGITVADATNPNHQTKLTSGGVFITADGGLSWKNAIRSSGVATECLTAGAVNTQQITILDGAFTTFRWDSSGLNAYDVSSSGVNLGKFVRFDHYGIYGYQGESGDKFTPASESDIWNNASFGMTWSGFFLKNKYSTHNIEISSTNDIRVVKDPTSATPIEVVKIGKLADGQYGLRLSDNSGNSTLETTNDGKLWLKQALNISSTPQSSSTDDYSIAIGYLSAYKTGQIHEVFNANNKFIVWEDGSLKATEGEFTGEVNATSGTIGSMTVEDLETATARVIIESDSGTIFKNGTGEKTLTAGLYQGATKITSGIDSYTWYKNNVLISSGTESSIKVTASSTNELSVYKCEIEYTPT